VLAFIVCRQRYQESEWLNAVYDASHALPNLLLEGLRGDQLPVAEDRYSTQLWSELHPSGLTWPSLNVGGDALTDLELVRYASAPAQSARRNVCIFSGADVYEGGPVRDSHHKARHFLANRQ